MLDKPFFTSQMTRAKLKASNTCANASPGWFTLEDLSVTLEVQNMKLSERLTELRKEKNLSQAELADALNVSRQSVSLWENGSTVPALDKLQFLAEFYDVTLDELFYSVEEKPKPQEAAPQATEENPKRKWVYLCAAAVVIVLVVAVLIAAIGHKENVKEPIHIDDIQGVVIETDGTFEFDQE